MASAVAVERPVGRLERLCWEREDRDRASPPAGCWFDAAAGEHPITFIESLCRHHKGEWAGQPLLLEEWQKRIDLSAVLSLPVDFDAKLRFDVFNVFNWSARTDYEERGTLSNGQPRNTYGLATSYQAPRSVRMQLQVGF